MLKDMLSAVVMSAFSLVLATGPALSAESLSGAQVRLAQSYDGDPPLKKGSTVTVELCLQEGKECLVSSGDRKFIIAGELLLLGDGRTALDFESERWSAVWASRNVEPAPLFPDVVAWGDSLTAGSGVEGRSYPSQMAALTTRRVVNHGIGGESAMQIFQRFQATPALHDHTTVIWAGRNDVASANSAATVSDWIRKMVALLPHDRYLVLSVTNGSHEPVGATGYNRILAINESLREAFGDRYLDVRSLLVDAATPEEAGARSSDVPPPSLLLDNIHLNERGHAIVASAVLARIRESEW